MQTVFFIPAIGHGGREGAPWAGCRKDPRRGRAPQGPGRPAPARRRPPVDQRWDNGMLGKTKNWIYDPKKKQRRFMPHFLKIVFKKGSRREGVPPPRWTPPGIDISRIVGSPRAPHMRGPGVPIHRIARKFFWRVPRGVLLFYPGNPHRRSLFSVAPLGISHGARMSDAKTTPHRLLQLALLAGLFHPLLNPLTRLLPGALPNGTEGGGRSSGGRTSYWLHTMG